MKLSWQHALGYIAKLNTENYLGYNDWRLPDIKELISLVDYSNYNPALPTGHPFTNVQSFYYWSSSTDAFDTNYTWIIGVGIGNVYYFNKGFNALYVWPVRAGQPGLLGNLDEPRFTDNGDGTVTDNLTGLMWTKDANIEIEAALPNRKAKNDK